MATVPITAFWATKSHPVRLPFPGLSPRFEMALTLSKLKELEIKEAQGLYEHPANQLIAGMQIKHIEQLTESIEKIEKVVLGSARELPYYEKLATLPGVGRILAMTITMEVGDIKRFADPGNFASYCRTVEAKRITKLTT